MKPLSLAVLGVILPIAYWTLFEAAMYLPIEPSLGLGIMTVQLFIVVMFAAVALEASAFVIAYRRMRFRRLSSHRSLGAAILLSMGGLVGLSAYAVYLVTV